MVPSVVETTESVLSNVKASLDDKNSASSSGNFLKSNL